MASLITSLSLVTCISFFSLALARDRSLVTDVLVLPLDITEYNKHKDNAQTVMNHFNRVGISTIYVYFVCKDEMC